MVACNRILFPVDLADFSPRIVPYVLAAVRACEAELHLLYAEPALKEHIAGQVPDIEVTRRFEAEARAEAEHQLTKVRDERFRDCPCTLRIAAGDPVDAILDYIREARIDLVILGTHGRKGIDRVVFGSVAENVIKRATVPVLAMNPYRVSGAGGVDLSLEGDAGMEEELDQYKPDS